MNLRLPVSTAFSLAVHGLLIFGLFQTIPALFSLPLYTTLDVTLASKPVEETPEQAYLKSTAPQQGAPLLSDGSNAQFIVAPGFRNADLFAKYDHSAVKRRTISAASHQANDAAYLMRWQQHIETLGTQAYQQSVAADNGGEVLMLVALNRAGELLEIQIRRSSGNKALDALAVSIVEQAAPFEPLPVEMQQDTDILEIIRTWKFHGKY